jgi:hypothetical protein
MDSCKDLDMMPKRLIAFRRSGFRQFIVLFLTLLFIAVLGQWLTGVYRSDLSQSPDEGAHYINGLLVHDYVADGFPGNRLAYALQYYAHYSRVTIGHWPPLYYMVQAGVYFITGPSIAYSSAIWIDGSSTPASGSP